MRACVAAALAASLVTACMEGLPPDLEPRRVVARPPADAAEPETPAPAPAPAAPVLVPQTGHVSQVWSVAFHPSGRFLATGGFDHTIGIWSLDGTLVAQLLGHREALKRVAWSADGKVLASIARDSRVIVWDLARFAPRLVIEHPGFDLALSADGKRLYVVGSKAELSVYDAESGKLLESVTTPNGEGRQLLGVELSPDGKSLATASLDGVVHLWSVKPLRVHGTVAARTRRVAFAPDGRLAVPSDYGVMVVDGASGKTLWFSKDAAGAAHVAWSRDGRRLFTGVGKDVVVLDGDSGKRVGKYSVGVLEALALSPDGALVATGNDDPQVRLWQAETGAPVQALGSPWGAVGTARFDPKGERIATAAAFWIDVWDARAGKILVRLRGKKRPPENPLWSPDGALIAASTSDGAVTVWDAASGAELATVAVPTRDDWGPRFAFAPDSSALAMFAGGRLSVWDRKKRRVVKTLAQKLALPAGVEWRGGVVAVGGDATVVLFDASSWKSVHSLDVKQLVSWGRVESLALAPDGKSVLVATSQHLGTWDVGSGQLLGKTEGRSLHAPPMFSPDGRLVAFPDRERDVTVWDGARAVELLRVDAASRQIRWSPDGKRLAVATDDGQIRVVEVATKKLERTLGGHEGRIWSLEWHPSGQALLAASHQARLHRLSDGTTLTLRARYDRASGVVHSGNAYAGDASLLRLRSGTSLEQATLTAPGAEQPDLLASFWR